MIAQVDDDNSGEIEFSEFLKVIENQAAAAAAAGDETDTIDAYVALGGNKDKSGCISSDKLINTCKEFGLTIDIVKLINEVDEDGSGEIEYEEVKAMMS